MRLRRLMLVVVGLLAVTVSAGADVPAIVVAGSARFGSGQCFTLAGAVATVPSPRQRWASAYWRSAPTMIAAGVCFEEDPHEDIAPSCTDTVSTADSTTVFGSGIGTDRKPYRYRIIDRPGGTDEVGVSQSLPVGSAMCGAADVATSPVTEGNFSLIAAG